MRPVAIPGPLKWSVINNIIRMARMFVTNVRPTIKHKWLTFNNAGDGTVLREREREVGCTEKHAKSLENILYSNSTSIFVGDTNYLRQGGYVFIVVCLSVCLLATPKRICTKFSGKVDNRARQLYKIISMLFLFPVTRDLLFTNI